MLPMPFCSFATLFANAVYIESLSRCSEFCHRSDPFDNFLCNMIVQILNVATFHANQVYVRFHIWIESRLPMWETQLLYLTELF